MKLLSLLDPESLRGSRVLLRADINVPLSEGGVLDDFRIRQVLPTIEYVRSFGASVRLLSHLGRSGETLKPVADALGKFVPVSFVSSFDVSAPVLDDTVVVFENLRSDPREEANDVDFAKLLASHGDIFVQDAFAVCHREHASTVRVPALLPAYAGFLLEAEARELTRARTPKSPSLAVLGGAKFETKEPLIRSFLETHTNVFVGGALLNEVLRAQGYEVGRSRVADGAVPHDILMHPHLMPVFDVRVVNEAGILRNTPVDRVLPHETIVDVGVDTAKALAESAYTASSVVWNGPLGWYERGFSEASMLLADALMANTGAHTVIGGGDTVALLQGKKIPHSMFVSTGGGAMLEFLRDGTLPGIAVLS